MRHGPFRNLILILGAIWIAGCGGGGEQRAPDGGDGRADTAPGDGATSDAPADTRPDSPTDMGIEAPGKPIGTSCLMAADAVVGTSVVSKPSRTTPPSPGAPRTDTQPASIRCSASRC